MELENGFWEKVFGTKKNIYKKKCFLGWNKNCKIFKSFHTRLREIPTILLCDTLEDLKQNFINSIVTKTSIYYWCNDFGKYFDFLPKFHVFWRSFVGEKRTNFSKKLFCQVENSCRSCFITNGCNFSNKNSMFLEITSIYRHSLLML